MNYLFTVCGRAGSKGLKNKNLKRMNGKPLVYYTLDIISLFQKKCDGETYVGINTDSEDLRLLVEEYEGLRDVIYVERKDYLASDHIGKALVVQDTYKEIAKKNNIIFDYIIDLDITSPLRTEEDVEKAIKVMRNSKNIYDVVFSVVPSRRSPYFNMVEEKKDGMYRAVCQSSYTARQQVPDVFELNASIYVYNPVFLKGLIDRSLLEYNCGISIMKDYLVLDIDSEEDFEMMEKLMHYLRF